jgi:ribosomal protein S18 acetylase RimI-like enzyme
MQIELRRVSPDDVPELGRICHDAFKDISERHGFPPDFASVETAQGVIGMLVQQEDVYSVAAADGERPVGSNYLNKWGDVAGIGPITVDLDAQGGGIGRELMRDVIKHARDEGFDMVRLMQDSFNMRSLALYSSLGFDAKEPVALLDLSPSGAVDEGFRPAIAADVDAMDALCRDVYRISRKGECATLIALGFPAFVLERNGRIAGYLLGSELGHGVAESDDAMLALLSSLGANAPGMHSFVPLRSGDLYRRALAAGHRNRKVMNMMALGPYDEPRGTYVPSVMF